MKQLVISLAVIFIIACSNNKSHQTSEKTGKENDLNAGKRKPATGDLCFSKTEKDTVLLQLTISDSVVSGNLFYHLFEKDPNKGTIKGKMSGDTLMANYTFWSEGVQSERQVAFLLKDSIAIEGFGEIKEENGRTKFANPRNLDFKEDGIVLQKTDCDKMEE